MISCLLLHPAWKRRGPIHKFVTNLLTYTLTHFLTASGPTRGTVIKQWCCFCQDSLSRWRNDELQWLQAAVCGTSHASFTFMFLTFVKFAVQEFITQLHTLKMSGCLIYRRPLVAPRPSALQHCTHKAHALQPSSVNKWMNGRSQMILQKGCRKL